MWVLRWLALSAITALALAAAPTSRATLNAQRTLGAHDPRRPVLRFLVPRTPRDACAQLTARYRRSLDRQYGPCLTAVRANPPAKHIRFSAIHVNGARASLHVRYRSGSRTLFELYLLVRQNGRWLINGARLLS